MIDNKPVSDEHMLGKAAEDRRIFVSKDFPSWETDENLEGVGHGA
jgi:hypothetical protein